ncbi:toprim domain-containing protein [Pelagibacterium sp. 26DY04]|uniref:toprim domain-containing protein n=1 Tax=Pelagibacterium sp. 26DY04 TaxID=2967130 RepID=UPI0028160312|nr:toprim domain-containing protein [Pelagibacterium sp. 26DY04]WMT88262.1 toprim domain-containing protein [Pelagibacterium sp. 26DY04]
MTEILEIKRILAGRALAVAEHLLPGGVKQANEWRAGSVNGEKGESLGVHLSGEKAGIWSDFATGESGDLIDLWCAAKGVSLAQGLEQIRAYLGLQRQQPARDPRPNYSRPPKPNCGKPKGRVRDYLIEDRNLTDAVLEAYRIGERGDEIIFPFLSPDGELVMAKSRKAADGEAPKPTAANCEPILFGWQAIPPHIREIVITEGEIDAMSFYAYGFPALSVPFGGGKGGKQKWIENEFDRLDRFEKIFVATDMDGPGEEAAAEIISRLGRHRCVRVKLPRKDANECLVDGVSVEEFGAAVLYAEGLDPEGLRRASDYHDEVVKLFWPEPGAHTGYTTPYRKLGDKLVFRPAEVTLWSGASGAGKSQILSDSAVDWVRQGSRICIASLEMKASQTLKRMVKQAGGVDRPTEPFIAAILQFLDQGILLYDHVGKAGVEPLLEVFDYARAKYGCDQFIIDSLMRLGIATDDYNGQEKAVFQLVDWAIKSNVHLHLVAHARKGEKGAMAPATEDIKGAMEIGANAFNIVTVWRNRAVEDQYQKAESDEERARIQDENSGVVMNVAKQRNGDFEGKIGLWFDQENYRYRSSHDDKGARRYVQFSQLERMTA